MSNAAEFTRSLELFEEDIKEILEEVPKRVVVRTFRALVRRSPVLTGYFRRNWYLKVGNRSGKNPQQVTRATKGLGRKYEIINDTIYGVRLEDGHSAQAPGGIVAPAAIEMEEHAKTAVEAIIQRRNRKR